MTVIISSSSSKLIVMASDSVITETINDGSSRAYVEGRKFYPYDGVGCVTTWGRNTGNRIGIFLDRQRISPQTHSVEDLRALVFDYLRREFQPGEDEGSEDVGYHVGGYDRSGKPRLFHIFWGKNRPPVGEDEIPNYHNYDHSEWLFVYNGRNDLACTVVDKLVQEVLTGQAIRYDIRTLIDRVCFCDFVVRFAAEMTPEVGLPIAINLIYPDNSIQRVFNKSFSPVDLDGPTLMRLKAEQSRHEFSSDEPFQNTQTMPTGTESPENHFGKFEPNRGGTVTRFP
jgi:hypothetical protein